MGPRKANIYFQFLKCGVRKTLGLKNIVEKL
jgi:hypothetical protein